jgi:small subunit ribosomal protein S6
MTLPAPTYDLVLIVDPRVEDAVRAKIVADTRATIEAQGELLRHDEWGERALTYPIDRKPGGEYHLLQFHAPVKQLLDDLDRTLRITDGLLRFRIIKLKPGVPDAPDMRSSATAPRRTETDEPREDSAAEGVPVAAAAVAESA